MNSPSPLRWAIPSFIGVLLAALVIVFALERGERDEQAAASAVMSYVKARRAGDAGKACKQLSGAQRRELVARVSRTPPSRSSPGDCERYVLARSRWSELARPALAAFRVAGGVALRFANDVRLVRPSGFNEPVVEVWKRDGRWRIDTQAAERSTFVRVCRHDGAAAGYCECLFDQTRARDPRLLDRGDGAMDLFREFESGRRAALIGNVTRSCRRFGRTRPV